MQHAGDPLTTALLSVILTGPMMDEVPLPPSPTMSTQPALETTQQPCRICAEPCTLRCSRCKEAYYCSKKHITEVRSLRLFYCGQILNIYARA
jgi:hypothetical protein